MHAATGRQRRSRPPARTQCAAASKARNTAASGRAQAIRPRASRRFAAVRNKSRVSPRGDAAFDQGLELCLDSDQDSAQRGRNRNLRRDLFLFARDELVFLPCFLLRGTVCCFRVSGFLGRLRSADDGLGIQKREVDDSIFNVQRNRLDAYLARD